MTMTDEERLKKANLPPDYYKCSSCGRVVGKLNLRAKRVVWKMLGAKGANVGSRTVAWLCIIPAEDGGPSCFDKDPDSNSEPLVGTPGYKGTRLDA